LGRASTKHDANNWGLSHPCDGDERDTLQLQRAKSACREKRRSCAEQHPVALAPQFLVLWTGYDQRSLGTNLQNFASIRMTLLRVMPQVLSLSERRSECLSYC
jgi:hypothetical protein